MKLQLVGTEGKVMIWSLVWLWFFLSREYNSYSASDWHPLTIYNIVSGCTNRNARFPTTVPTIKTRHCILNHIRRHWPLASTTIPLDDLTPRPSIPPTEGAEAPGHHAWVPFTHGVVIVVGVSDADGG